MYNHSSFSTAPLSSLNSDDIKGLSSISIMPLSTAAISALNSSVYSRSGISPLTTSQMNSSFGLGLNNVGFSSLNIPPSTFHATGNAKFDGDIIWKGRNLGKILETIESRLAILQPKPEKLEKYAALEKAYAHYKLLETLINDEEEDGE